MSKPAASITQPFVKRNYSDAIMSNQPNDLPDKTARL